MCGFLAFNHCGLNFKVTLAREVGLALDPPAESGVELALPWQRVPPFKAVTLLGVQVRGR